MGVGMHTVYDCVACHLLAVTTVEFLILHSPYYDNLHSVMDSYT